ncbi:MAG: hypothetical protein WCD18_00330 [Thermosynechococcaceae cyanobacterium]
MAHATHCIPRLEKNPGDRFHLLQTTAAWLTQSVQQGWQELTHPLELRVWHKMDRRGISYWSAYDPRTGRSFTSGSEADMRYWIEQRHRM